MQPSAKRRAGNQIGKDNDDDEVEGVDPGTWQSDPDQISRRRKVKARRAGEMPEGGASVPSSYNPFSEISLAAPSLNLNQIAETNLLPSAEVRSVSAQFEKKEQPKDLQDDVDFRKSSGLGLHSTPNPFAVLSSSHLGREGIDGLGNYPVFDSTPLSGMRFLLGMLLQVLLSSLTYLFILQGSLELYPHPCFRTGHQEQNDRMLELILI
jgi:hypothetical protein